MPVELSFRKRLVENARTEVQRTRQPRSKEIRKGQISIIEERQQQIEQSLESLRKKHAKVLTK